MEGVYNIGLAKEKLGEVKIGDQPLVTVAVIPNSSSN